MSADDMASEGPTGEQVFSPPPHHARHLRACLAFLTVLDRGAAPRRRLRNLGTVACVLVLAWFLMSFYMDNSNDSETLRYVQDLHDRVVRGEILPTAMGPSLLTQYLAYPAFVLYQGLGSGAFLIRGFVLVRLFQSLAIFGLAYVYYRRLGFGRMATLFGLTAVWWALALATYDSGWDLDTYNQVILFLATGVALVAGNVPLIGVLAAAAGLMRETGALLPVMVLAAGNWRLGTWRDRVSGRQAAAAIAGYLLTSALVFVVVRALPADWARVWPAPPEASNPEQYVLGFGAFVLWTVVALASVRYAPPPLIRLLLVLTPAWLLLEVPLSTFARGARLAPLIPVVLLPIAMFAMARGWRPDRRGQLPATAAGEAPASTPSAHANGR